jgi:hypothetical protein
MTARTFADSAGATWEVFEVRRASDRPGSVSAGLERGWLAFVNGAEKRRLAPFPPDWAGAGDTELERLCNSARRAAPARIARPAPADAASNQTLAAPDIPAPVNEGEGDEDPVPVSAEVLAVEEAVRAFAHEARSTGLAAVEAMVRMRAMLADRFPDDAHPARNTRLVRRWFVEAFYFDRNA